MQEQNNVRVIHEQDRNRFRGDVDGGSARLDYELTPGTMTITHTFVPDEARGRGVAGALTVAALQHAREAGLKVVPQCPYVRDFIDRNQEFADLLA